LIVPKLLSKPLFVKEFALEVQQAKEEDYETTQLVNFVLI
jgi:hypothetical protein